MINFLNKNRILFFIILLAAFLRFWNLGNVPPSASMDEASIGYNAYSVLKTGRDEYGEFPLISQRSYDDWRRSTYLFLVIPFIAIFDLNIIAVRLPAIILSILTVLATYYIVLNLFSKRSNFSYLVAILSSFLLAINPWHIYISRLGHESNACLAFLVFGVLFFLQGLENNKKLILSLVFFTLSMVSYYSGQAFIPVFGLGLLFIFRKKLISIILSSKKTLIFLFIFAILLIPIFWTIFSPQALVRFRGTSNFDPKDHSEMFHQRVVSWNKAVENKDIIGMVFYHRYLFPLIIFTQGYFSHFNLKWLFTNSGSEPFKVPHMGLLNLWESPLIIIGILVLVFTKLISSKNKKVIFLWFLLAAIPASIATQAPHAMRYYNVLPTWQIFSALGFVYLLYQFRKYRMLILLSLSLLITVGIFIFYRNYFFVFPKEQSNSFNYALSKTIPYVIANKDKYEKIVFSNQDNLYQSYMLYLFYSMYDPYLYQKQGGTKSGGFAQSHIFGKYNFTDLKSLELKQDYLYIGNKYDVKSGSVIRSFDNLNKEPEVYVFVK